MKSCILQRVAYRHRLPGKKDHLRWAILLGQREGLSLLLAPAPDTESSHGLVIAEEDVGQRVFYDANSCRFPLEPEDLVGIGVRLQTIGEQFQEQDVLKFFRGEDF
jgi:hypothetical protein